MSTTYFARVAAEPEGGFTITFDGLDGVSFAAGETAIGDRAHDLLATILAAAIGDGRPEPLPGGRFAGARPVTLDALTTAKLGLRRAMHEAGISGRELARRLGVAETAMRRLLDLDHRSRIDQVEAALSALGKRLDAVVRDAA